ncbi:2-isopropylmalate synthase [Caldanaerobius fijiensis DSM 17918]|uniref:Citramalate synthase n=1 Tax=Caldanaerobius fijiensis DSM 17918 TaxID=1121256 RepID=A0A1M4WLW1_9THEO|nr:citramalate synthase [Caldanaerobius fijiensis]SHE82194.1 2-isopropylmalate synthase [Caldanaerobius fijiensis DSM 17918]
MIYIYDSVLRDGAQAEGISYSVEDKLKIVKKLDEFGISYIEAGNPGSNPKDADFFKRLKGVSIKNAKVVAFGSTRRPGIKTDEDNNVKALLEAGVNTICIFGKSWDLHVTDVLRTSLDENLNMIYDTVSFFASEGYEVIFDAEHFFDGYKANADYAMKTLKAAADAGAKFVVLCDTNGGSFPDEVYEIVSKVVNNISVAIGIHAHNDSELAVANSITAVKAGASMVQGCINGYGERTGNANLCSIIPALQLKLGYECIPDDNIKMLTSVSKYVSEVANMQHDNRMPYVGDSAFAHKGGMHIDAVLKNTRTYEHIDPESVGNERRILMSEVSGKSTILSKIKEIEPTLTKNSPETKMIIDELKKMEYEGYQFEGAEGSFYLIVKKLLGKFKKHFDIKYFKVIDQIPWDLQTSATAMVKVAVDGIEEVTAAEGNGPVNALDAALRRALERFYPVLKSVVLTDYKVRVLNSDGATAAKVRVLIESSDREECWSTMGVSTNIIQASWDALIDSIEYKLAKEEDKKQK